MNGRSVILDLLPDEAKKTLSDQIYYYKHGDRNSYFNTGKHKSSASQCWHKYADIIKDYPRTIVKDGDNYHIVDMACGIRSHSDKLLCIREVSSQFAYEALIGSQNSYKYRWRDDVIFYDEDVKKFFHFIALDVPVSDKAFKQYWLESVKEIIEQRSWGEDHPDNSIRKLVREYKYWLRVEEDEKHRERVGDYDMCGRCYKRHCCCDNGSRDLTYTVNPHSMSVEVSKGFRTLDFTMEEVAELASFFATARTKIKEAKVAELKAQADEIAKQLEAANSL